MMKLIPPTEEQLAKICEEINLTKDQHRKDVQTLRGWLMTQPHLPHDIEDTILASMIVGCKNSLERSKQMLDKYLTNRTSCPDFYSNRDPLDPISMKQAKLLQFFPIPGMTPEGYRVSIFRLASPDVSSADFTLRMNAIHFLSTYDVRFQEEPYWGGEVIIIDYENVGLKHILAMSIPVLKKYNHCSNESMPVRYKKLIHINVSPVVETFLSIVKTILKDKLVNRTIMTTENHTFLHKHIPKRLLPNEYGGQAGTLEELNNAWQLTVQSYRDWFIKDMARKVDETKRPENTKECSKDFGTEGSFRSLSID